MVLNIFFTLLEYFNPSTLVAKASRSLKVRDQLSLHRRDFQGYTRKPCLKINSFSLDLILEFRNGAYFQGFKGYCNMEI